jgi:hemoglobin-like flavoprotein
MDIQDSLRVILERKECISDLFYKVFLDEFPEVRHHFEGVTMQYQAVSLTMALMVIETHYAHSFGATEMYLKYLGSKHHARKIEPESYPKFRVALLTALEQFHNKDWNPDLARQWDEAMEKAIQTMSEGYKQHYTV